MFERLHCIFWFKINMVHAYLALHRGDKLLAAEYECDAMRYESELKRLEILKCQ
jgi:hypothetical protein